MECVSNRGRKRPRRGWLAGSKLLRHCDCLLDGNSEPDTLRVRGEVGRRHQAVCDAFGASASPWFQAIQDSQHRDAEVLMLYPSSLVACEERFGSWMVQYGYANYVTPRRLLQHGQVGPGGHIEMAGRRFGTVAVLFEPLPP